MLKKCLSLLMAVCLFAGCLCACGEKENSGKKTLVWAMPFYTQTDDKVVLAEINKELEKQMPGVELSFMYESSLAKKWPLLMAGKTQIDIAHAGFDNDLATDINRKSYQPLDDLINKYAPSIKKDWETYSDQFLTGSSNGVLYAIPNVQNQVHDTKYIRIPKELSSLFDAETFMSLIKKSPTLSDELCAFLDDYMAKAVAYIDANPDSGLYAPYIDIEYFYDNFVKRGYEFFSEESNLCYEVFADDEKVTVESFNETDTFKIFAKWARSWYEKGFIPQDVLTGMNTTGRTCMIFSSILDFNLHDENGDGIIEPGESAVMGDTHYIYNCMPNEQKFRGISVIGSELTYNTIPTTAKYPEEAIQLLELLRTEKGSTLLNLIIYGIEGKHYSKNDDGTIKPIGYSGGQGTSSSPYGKANWMVSNMLDYQYIVEPFKADSRDKALKYLNEVRKNFYATPVCGLQIINDSVTKELSMIASVVEEYELQIIGGTTKDYTAMIETLGKNMKTAGLDKVKEEYQKQVDEYIANAKK